VAVGLLLIVATALHLAEPGHGREDVRGATAWLDAHVPADRPVLVTSREMAYLARFHWPGRPIVDYPGPQVVVDPATVGALLDALPWQDGRATFVFGRAWLSDPSGALERAIGGQYPSCGRLAARGVRIYCVEQPGGGPGGGAG
jgi:hypothetical protein